MKLYNTLTRNVQTLVPLQKEVIRIYSCGPTVYNHAHIGNLSAYIFADTLRRVSSLDDQTVKHVMNYTDVDDKTIRHSRERYPDTEPHQALRLLTDKFIDLFLQDMRQIGNDIDAISFVRATESIEGMKELITRLWKADFAYIAEDGVYFSIDAYKKAGKKYGQLLDITADNTSAERIQNDEYDKDNVHDFALWKTKKEGEPAWEFMLDGKNLEGRPGWHIECSVMSRQELGQPFDVHAGGIDLIFPHHENEIAQSTALEANPLMAQIFSHNGHILVDGKKMAKSANNFYTLQDIVDRGFDPHAFRLLVLQAHYRSQVHFSWENLQAAQNRLRDIYAWADLRWQPKTDEMTEELDELFRVTRENISHALQDDLNTPQALAHLGKLMEYMFKIPIPGVEGKHTDGTLAFLDHVFGLELANRPDITPAQKDLIKQREAARISQNWAKSDEIRYRLAEERVGLRDTLYGTFWYRLG